MSELVWFKSSYSDAGGNNCVEVAEFPDDVAIRDSVYPDRVLRVRKATLSAFLAGVRAGVVVRGRC